MSFFFPIALAGLAVLAVPLLIHLLFRQKPRAVRFPAFRFLLQKQKTNQRSLKLRHLLLLLLRMLLLAALVLVLARPWFHTQGAGPAALVLVIDTSPRMGYRSADGSTRLDQARSRAREVLAQLDPDSKVLVLESAATPFSGPEGARLPNWVLPPAAEKLVADLEERPASRPLGEPIRQGLNWLKGLATSPDPSDRARPRFLCVISDRTAGSWPARDLNVLAEVIREIPSLSEDAAALPGVRCSVFDVGLAEPADLALVRLEVGGRETVSLTEKWMLKARVRASGPLTADPRTVRVVCRVPWNAGGPPLEETTVLLPGQEKEVAFIINSAEVAWDGGFAQMEVTLEPVKGGGALDPLAFSDRKFLTVGLRERGNVLILTEDSDLAEPLRAALIALGYEPKVRAPAAGGSLDAAAVYLFEVAEPGKELWESLEAFVQRGGGLAIVPGGTEHLKMGPGSFQGTEAGRLLPGRLKGLVEKPARWDLEEKGVFPHPMLWPFREWVGSATIDFIQKPPETRRYLEIEPEKAARVIARYTDDQKSPALLELPASPATGRHGKVLLFTTPLDAREKPWNNYLDTSFFLVLAGLATDYLVNAPPLNLTMDRREPLTWPVPTWKGYLGYRLVDPAKKERRLASPEVTHLLSLPAPALPGNYRLEGDRGKAGLTRVGAFSINLAEREVDLARVDVETIEGVFGPGSVRPAGHEAEAVRLPDYQTRPVELLPYLLLLVLFLLAGENLLSNLFYGKPATTEGTDS